MFGFKENHTLKLSQVLKHLLKYNLNTIPFRLRERHKKLRFLLKKGFLFKDFEREELMTLSLAIILILKFMPFIKFLKKNNKQKINLCQNRSF
jgi:hypothetical protein